MYTRFSVTRGSELPPSSSAPQPGPGLLSLGALGAVQRSPPGSGWEHPGASDWTLEIYQEPGSSFSVVLSDNRSCFGCLTRASLHVIPEKKRKTDPSPEKRAS